MPKFSYRYKHVVYSRKNYGLAILSRYKIIDSGKEDFPAGSSPYNKVIWADIVLPGNDTVRVVNTHLKSIGLDPANLGDLPSAELSQEELEKQKRLLIRPPPQCL